MLMRVGIGYDVHKLAAGRQLILGGVKIPHDTGLEGHSDADVLMHAVADALLGAAALGDIGSHFPDTDDRWKNADSARLLRHVAELLQGAGYEVVNVDATVAIQRPKLRPYIESMRLNIAASLGKEIETVSVKATTTERLGFEGREEGVSAYAVCLVRKDR